MPSLRIKTENGQGHEIGLNEGLNTLGRGEGNDFQIDDPTVSERHCELLLTTDKTIVRDLGSSNGTFVNGEPVQEAVIRAGQILRLGSVELILDSVVPLKPLVGAHPSSRQESTNCVNHPHSPGLYICTKCHGVFCESCLTLRSVGKTILRFCSRCGGSCALVESKEGAKAKMASSFSELLAGAFVYPFKRDGLILVIAGTLFFALVGIFASFSFIIAIFAGGYFCAYLQKIIQSSAQGDDGMPAWPDVSSFGEEVLQPFLQFLGTFLLCLAPGILGIRFGPPDFKGYFYALYLLGGLYLPMALLTVAMHDTIAALDPRIVLSSILRVPLGYAGVCVTLAAIVGVDLGMGWLANSIGMPIATSLLTGFVSLYLQVVAMRVLGLFYYCQKDRLKWF